MTNRQGSIASFFNKKPAPKLESKPTPTTKPIIAVKKELKREAGDGIIDFTDETDEPNANGPVVESVESSRKRRKKSTGPDTKAETKSKSDSTLKSTTKDKSDHLTIDPSIPFTYPPSSHPSYPAPPSSSHNHPITIPPPQPELLSSLSFNPNPKIILKPDLNLDLLYFNQFIDTGSKELYNYLLESLPWYRVTYTTKGFTVNTPRWTTVFGKDTSKDWGGYPAGVKPRAIPEILLRLMEIVEKVTGETYNFTLVNYYASGSDSISYHSDSESFLGPNPCIASLSLGSSRDFLLRHTNKNIKADQKYVLKDGDMVVMKGGTQGNWLHSIPKRAGVGGRLNLTFRKGVVRYATKNYNDYNVGKGGMFRWIKGEMVEQK